MKARDTPSIRFAPVYDPNRLGPNDGLYLAVLGETVGLALFNDAPLQYNVLAEKVGATNSTFFYLWYGAQDLLRRYLPSWLAPHEAALDIFGKSREYKQSHPHPSRVESEYLRQLQLYYHAQHAMCEQWAGMHKEKAKAAISAYVRKQIGRADPQQLDYYIANYMSAVRILKSPATRAQEVALYYQREQQYYPENTSDNTPVLYQFVAEGTLTQQEADILGPAILYQYQIWREEDGLCISQLMKEARARGEFTRLKDTEWVKAQFLSYKYASIAAWDIDQKYPGLVRALLSAERVGDVARWEKEIKRVPPQERFGLLAAKIHPDLLGRGKIEKHYALMLCGSEMRWAAAVLRAIPKEDQPRLILLDDAEFILHRLRNRQGEPWDSAVAEEFLNLVPKGQEYNIFAKNDAIFGTVLHSWAHSHLAIAQLHARLLPRQWDALIKKTDSQQNTALHVAGNLPVFMALWSTIPQDSRAKWVEMKNSHKATLVHRYAGPGSREWESWDWKNQSNADDNVKVLEQLRAVVPLAKKWKKLVTAQDAYGYSPFHRAACSESGSIATLQMLFTDFSADECVRIISAKSHYGYTVLAHATTAEKAAYLLGRVPADQRVKLILECDQRDITVLCLHHDGSTGILQAALNATPPKEWHHMLMQGAATPLAIAVSNSYYARIKVITSAHLASQETAADYYNLATYFSSQLTQIPRYGFRGFYHVLSAVAVAYCYGICKTISDTVHAYSPWFMASQGTEIRPAMANAGQQPALIQPNPREHRSWAHATSVANQNADRLHVSSR
jgi:hypothetical protein